jgi:hypothetical protein
MSKRKRPLLRGALVEVVEVVARWWPGPGPGQEHRQCLIDVFCPYCDRMHTHGWDPANNARVVEFRVAHCDQGDLFYGGGYWISVWRQSDPGSAAHAVRPGRPIVRPLAQQLKGLST